MYRAFACLFAAFVAVDGTSTLRLLPESLVESVGSRCLDGSPAGYYQNLNPQSRRFVIYLEGGGYCMNQETCVARSTTPYGSSKSWPQTMPPTADRDIISSDKDLNPDFYADNQIYVPYCSGDVYSGTRKTTSADTFDLYFAGHLIIEGIMQDLALTAGLAAATEIIVGGYSAGGVGTINNLDFIADKFPNAKVSGYLNGGWFITMEDFGQMTGVTDKSITGVLTSTTQALYDPFVDQTCASIFGPLPIYCIFGAIVQSFLSSRIFVAEAIFDAEQIFIEHGCPAIENETVAEYIGLFGDQMTTSLLFTTPSGNGLKQTSGLFLASCLGHYIDWNLLTVQQQSLQQTFHNWYFSTSGSQHAMDEQSPLPNNPTCLGSFSPAFKNKHGVPLTFPARH
eukprot:TRINITY_DN6060_c0_g1_i1.p1 TRINITY_DN6060_c0_g1~~TRINITY_DN6060_c0_g1_i1.p1  ORF type:complete len:396 (-),score=118.20 TRINITY_DN6060_c0_g1_i1:162-1349(-)